MRADMMKVMGYVQTSAATATGTTLQNIQVILSSYAQNADGSPIFEPQQNVPWCGAKCGLFYVSPLPEIPGDTTKFKMCWNDQV